MTPITLQRALRWTLRAVPMAAVFFAFCLAFVIPIVVGSEIRLEGRLLALTKSSRLIALISVVCILGWIAVVHRLPRLEQSWRILAPCFVAWVCLLGELATLLFYGERPSLFHLVPFSLTALVILLPRHLDPSLSLGAFSLSR